MSTRYLSVLLAAQLLPASTLRAQHDPATVRMPVEWITVESGLPQGMVRAILQDRTGYMWFGTKDGLVRSDGYVYTVFRHDDADSTSLCGDHITALLEDREGMLWVATESSGIDRYDPATGRFTHVTINDAGTNTHLGIRTLREHPRGDIWAITEQGLLLVVPHGRLEAGRPPPPLEREWGYGFGDSFVFDPNGRLWISSRDSLFIFNAAGKRAVLERTWSLATAWKKNRSILRHALLFLDPQQLHVAVCLDSVMLSFDLGKLAPIDTFLTDHYNTPMLIDAQGWAWFHDRDLHWKRIHMSDHRTEIITGPGWEDPPGAETRSPLCWAMDRQGNIWAGTNGYGALRIDQAERRFSQWLTGTSHYFASIGPDPVKLVLRGDLLEWSPQHQRWEPSLPGAWLERHRMRTGWTSCAVDHAGRYWMCTAPIPVDQQETDVNVQVLVMDQGGEVRELHGLLPGDRPNEAFTGAGSEAWVLVEGAEHPLQASALLRCNGNTLVVEQRYPLPFPWPFSEAPAISAWLPMPGHILIGTKYGLFDLNVADGSWKRLLDAEDANVERRTGPVLSTWLDPADGHTLWVGTHGNGLFRYSLKDGAIRRTTKRNGLPNDVLYGILGDAHGALWCSTNAGLCQFDPRTGAVRTYTTADGLAGNEFNRYSAARLPDGRMYFAGVDGIISFDPEEFYRDVDPSPTVITGLRLMNKEPSAEEKRELRLTAPIDRLASITLPYDQRMITFSFACLDHTAPEKNNYRYTLEGFSTNWIEAGTTHEATFTNLDPGEYVFRVQGRNTAGVLDERGAAITLIITPPWWGTWWFRIAALLAVAGSVYAFYRYRLAQVVKVVRVRERIARDLHDEIGSTLSSVQLFSAVAQRKTEGQHPEAHELLGRITEGTTSVMEAMNDIVWAVSAENDDLAHVVQRMNSYAERLAGARGCTLHFAVQDGITTQHLGMTQRKNLYLIFKEALNNAVKYAGGANLWIDLRKEGPGYLLRVRDDGAGFDVQAKRADNLGGNGLGNMRRRAAEMRGSLVVDSAPGQGTTVELRFAAAPNEISVDPMTPPADGRR